MDELKGRLSGRQDQPSGSSCEVSGGAEAADDGRMNSASCVAEDDGAVTPAVAASEESAAAAAAAEYCCYDHAAYGGGLLPEPFCTTPELWDTWPLLEWNAVA